MAFDAASGSMKPARNAFVTPVFVTEDAFSGGLGSYISRMAQALRDSGHVPEVFVLNPMDLPPLAVRLLQALPFPAWFETAPIEEGTEGHEDGPVRRGRVDPT